jgi:hypothetical protein
VTNIYYNIKSGCQNEAEKNSTATLKSVNAKIEKPKFLFMLVVCDVLQYLLLKNIS